MLVIIYHVDQRPPEAEYYLALCLRDRGDRSRFRSSPALSSCRRRPSVVHYPIRRTRHGDLRVANDDRRYFVGLSELVDYFRLNRGRLPTRLCRRRRRSRSGPRGTRSEGSPRPGRDYDATLELDRRSVQLSSHVVRRTATSTTWLATYRPATHGSNPMPAASRSAMPRYLLIRIPIPNTRFLSLDRSCWISLTRCMSQ